MRFIRREAAEELWWTCSRRARLTGVHLAMEHPGGENQRIQSPGRAATPIS